MKKVPVRLNPSTNQISWMALDDAGCRCPVAFTDSRSGLGRLAVPGEGFELNAGGRNHRNRLMIEGADGIKPNGRPEQVTLRTLQDCSADALPRFSESRTVPAVSAGTRTAGPERYEFRVRAAHDMLKWTRRNRCKIAMIGTSPFGKTLVSSHGGLNSCIDMRYLILDDPELPLQGHRAAGQR